MPHDPASPGVERTPPRFSTLVLLTATAVVSLNMFVPALPSIAADLAASYGQVSWAISGYLAATAVAQLVFGPLSDRYGRRPVILVALAIYAVASVTCMLATSLEMFLAARVCQVGVVAGSALSPAIIRDTTEERRAASLLGYIGMAMAVGPIVGPSVGGALTELWGWRSVFGLYALLGSSALLLVWVDLGETNNERSATLTAQMRQYPELLGSARFWANALAMSFGVGAFYAFIAGAPLLASAVFEMSPALLGLCIGTITMGFFCGSFLSGRLSEAIGPIRMILAGRTVSAVGPGLALLLWSFGVFSEVTFFGAAVLVGIGNGLTTPNAMAGIAAIRKGLAGSASGLALAMLTGGGALLTALTGALVRPGNAEWSLLVVLFGATLAGLVAAIWLRRVVPRAPRSTTT